MSTEDITAQIQEIYGLDVSKTFISDITNKLIPVSYTHLDVYKRQLLFSLTPVIGFFSM